MAKNGENSKKTAPYENIKNFELQRAKIAVFGHAAQEAARPGPQSGLPAGPYRSRSVLMGSIPVAHAAVRIGRSKEARRRQHIA